MTTWAPKRIALPIPVSRLSAAIERYHHPLIRKKLGEPQRNSRKKSARLGIQLQLILAHRDLLLLIEAKHYGKRTRSVL